MAEAVSLYDFRFDFPYPLPEGHLSHAAETGKLQELFGEEGVRIGCGDDGRLVPVLEVQEEVMTFLNALSDFLNLQVIIVYVLVGRKGPFPFILRMEGPQAGVAFEYQVFVVGDDSGDYYLLLLEFPDGSLIEAAGNDKEKGGYVYTVSGVVLVMFLEVRAEVLPGALDLVFAEETGLRGDDHHVALMCDVQEPRLADNIEDNDVLLKAHVSRQGYLDVDEVPVGVPVGLGRREGVCVALGGKHDVLFFGFLFVLLPNHLQPVHEILSGGIVVGKLLEACHDMGVRNAGGHFDEPLAAPEPLAGTLVVPFDFPVRHEKGVDMDHVLEEGETGPHPVTISRDGVILEYLHGCYLIVLLFLFIPSINSRYCSSL